MDRPYNSKVESLLSLSAHKIISLTKTYKYSYVVVQTDKQKRYWKTRKQTFLLILLQGVLLGQLIISFAKKDILMGLAIGMAIIISISVPKWHGARWARESKILRWVRL